MPDLAEVLAARAGASSRTCGRPRCTAIPPLDALAGARVWVKHENHQPVGAFKVRGGVNLVSQLTADERRRGVIAASTGNHGQSVAYAADVFGVRAVICMPEQANPVKVESMRALGAEVVFHGGDFDAAREHCEKLATEHGYRYFHSGDEPLHIAGVATYTLEILEARPDIEAARSVTVRTPRPAHWASFIAARGTAISTNGSRPWPFNHSANVSSTGELGGVNGE